MLSETIIVASNISHSEKIKSLASFGKKTFNTRYMSTYELAQYLLERSGIIIDKTFIPNDDLAAKLYKGVKKIGYFSELSYNDILGLLSSVNDLRHYIDGDEEKELLGNLPDTEFKEKNESIKKFYKLLKKTLGDTHIDELGVIRYAYEHTKIFNDLNIVFYEGDKINRYKLDKALINKACGKEVVPTSFNDSINIKTYTKAFSQVNEIESILNYIYKNNLPFDQCLIVGAETSDYSTILSNYQALLGFPLCVGVGKNVIETNPGKLFSLACDFTDNLYHYEYLSKIIYNESFDLTKFKEHLSFPEDLTTTNTGLYPPNLVSLDSVIKTVGDLRLSFSKEDNDKKIDAYFTLLNKYVAEKIDEEDITRRDREKEYVKAFADILSNGIAPFIVNYAIRNNEADESALVKINKMLLYGAFDGVSYSDIRKVIYKQKVSRNEVSKDTLYFTSIDRASSALRKYLFVVGLSSNNYPGDNKEDPYLLDEDYVPFGEDNASYRTINNNRNTFLNLMKEATSLDVDIHLSYSYYNSISLKTQNASSVIFEVYKLENGNDKTISDLEKEFEENKSKFITVNEFFKNTLLPTSKIASDDKEGMNVEIKKPEYVDDEDKVLPVDPSFLTKPLSPSAIELYVECPYKFYLARVLGIEQEEKVDIYKIIPANDLGTLAHSLMEDIDKYRNDKDSFLAKSKERFYEYFVMHYVDNKPLIDANYEDFKDMMSNAYDMNDDAKTVIKEQSIRTTYDNGLILRGFPDKVIRRTDGTYVVVDYKTGGHIKHDASDPYTVLQCVIYAYILEHNDRIKKLLNNPTVSGFEYLYIKLKQRVSNISDNSYSPMDQYYIALDTVLTNLKTSCENGRFKANLKSCKNCYHKSICPRGKK